MKCTMCGTPLLGYVHSNGKEQGDICIKCGKTFNQEEFRYSKGDYEEKILAKQDIIDWYGSFDDDDDDDDCYCW